MNTFRPVALFAAVLALSACGIGESVSVEELGGDEAADFESALTTKGRFETFVGRDGKHYFHLLAGNGEKVLASEGYSTAAAAAEGVRSVKTNGQNPARYLLREASDASPYFVLTSSNGSIIGVSEMYSSKAAVERAVNTVVELSKLTAAQPEAAPTAARFQVFRGLDAKYYFHLRAHNGEIVLQSQAYASKSSANGGVMSAQSNGVDSARYQVRAAADGRFFFVLRATNGRTIGWGETYATQSSAQAAVKAVTELLLGESVR